MVRNKKAEEGTTLGGTLVGVVIAVLCIGILIYLGVAIYSTLDKNQDLPKAQSTLQEVMNIVNGLEKVGESQTLLLYNPRNWALTYTVDYKDIPKSCNGQKCLCICLYDKDFNTFMKNCDDLKKSTCQVFDSKKINLISNQYDTLATGMRAGIKIESVEEINISLGASEIKIEKIG